MLEDLENFPFLTVVSYLDQEYLGIIGNSDNQITSMYIYSLIPEEFKKKFLELGQLWWWETNRQIPINVIMKEQWHVFRPSMRSFITKDLTIITGPCVSLDSVINKRVKRRQIQLVRRLDLKEEPQTEE